jgi:putative flavoprotein involved in K+ transport
VGGGQAGLAVSQALAGLGIEHVVFERGRVAETWRGRWDSFCLVTPNWTLSLPTLPYAGNEPEGFVPRDEIVNYLERFATTFQVPVEEGIDVVSISHRSDEFVLTTSAGEVRTQNLVLCTGAYQRPHRPPVSGDFPKHLLVVDAEQYTNATALPPGRVLVVGSGQTGCQIADELQEAGRETFLACGRAPWFHRRLGGRDVISWLNETDYFEATLASLPSPAARLAANVQISGRGGGRDVHYRALHARGIVLLGHLQGAAGRRAEFAPDLLDSVAWGDARYEVVRKLLREQLPARGLTVPELPDLEPFRVAAPTDLDLDGFGAVIFTSGFRPDYARWVGLPAFDDLGFPITDEGASTVVPGLYFAGVHFLRKRKSSLIFGVGEDAAIVARKVAGRLGSLPVPA